jgi:hypothetical protein
MASKALPDWDADSPQLRRNLGKVFSAIERDAARRAVPRVATAKRWQAQMMEGLAVGKPEYAGRFRGEPGLERCRVHVDGVYGSAPWEVADELKAFESTLQLAVNGLDARYPDADSLDDDGQSAAGAAAMRGQWRPTVNLFRQMLKEHFAMPGAVPAARKKPKAPS